MEDTAREKEINEFVDAMLLIVGVTTQKSISSKESKKLININLPLRPSVLTTLTNLYGDSIKPLPKEEKQKVLAEGLGLFLSDMIDAGVLHSARKLSMAIILERGKKGR